MHKKFFALLDEQPLEGGNGNTPAPTAPPVGSTIAKPQRTEREVDLEQELQIVRTERDGYANRVRKLETDISHIEQENTRLKTPTPPGPPADTRGDLERWMDGE